jgi:hypothetical protein
MSTEVKEEPKSFVRRFEFPCFLNSFPERLFKKSKRKFKKDG